jgi:hypothetical protein
VICDSKRWRVVNGGSMARIVQTTNEVVNGKKEAEARIICFFLNRTDNNKDAASRV